MIHWRELDSHGKIDAIRQVWFPGCSTAQIAANLGGVTRNAIIGMYHRFPNSLIDKPLVKRGIVDDAAVDKKKRRNSVTFLFSDKRVAKPLPEPADTRTEARLCGKPLMMLKPKECRFAVNNAVGDDIHLFCARPAERSYCAHHNGRAYREAAR